MRRIQQETGVRRETAGDYLRAAGIAVRPAGGWGKRPAASKPANEVSPDSGAELTPSATSRRHPPSHRRGRKIRRRRNQNRPTRCPPKLLLPAKTPRRAPANAYRDFIELSLSKGRNAKAIYRDLADDHGFTRSLRQCQALRAPLPRNTNSGSTCRNSDSTR